MLVETCVLTGEAAALKTIIDLFLLAAYTYIAGFKQLALLLSAPLASCYGQMIQKLLKVRILCKDGFVKQVHKTLCVHIKIAQCPFEFRCYDKRCLRQKKQSTFRNADRKGQYAP